MEFRVVCCESQDISSGMRKIGNWSDQFGTEIALRQGVFVQDYSRVITEASVSVCQMASLLGNSFGLME